MTRELAEGWHLMSTADLERALRRWREGPDAAARPADALRVSVPDALAYRNLGNVPDYKGRSLRLVLHVNSAEDLANLDRKRMLYEPDFHDPPDWRREGSRPVNVVPLRDPDIAPTTSGPWWTDEQLAALEDGWRTTGRVRGVVVPGEIRAFVYKTVLGLQAAGREVTVESIADSVARWVPADDADRIRAALIEANPR